MVFAIRLGLCIFGKNVKSRHCIPAWLSHPLHTRSWGCEGAVVLGLHRLLRGSSSKPCSRRITLVLDGPGQGCFPAAQVQPHEESSSRMSACFDSGSISTPVHTMSVTRGPTTDAGPKWNLLGFSPPEFLLSCSQ